ncbi:hypothetical protein M6B38_154625 [Iris pallida]|uniref:Uncharacterized protein n=1 Tax=Iris pallida TaxID=29817 RepID=A0AAX6F517_IRIPA|nr:hypothetical protein M6B38_154625 [Iris pallida]
MAFLFPVPRTSMTVCRGCPGHPDQTCYPYLKPRYAQGNKSTNNPPASPIP